MEVSLWSRGVERTGKEGRPVGRDVERARSEGQEDWSIGVWRV